MAGNRVLWPGINRNARARARRNYLRRSAGKRIMDIPYSPDIYITNARNSARFALGVSGENMLGVMGLNPSTADDQSPDPTVRKVLGFAARAGYDGFLLMNLYPQRTPFPDALHKRGQKQLAADNRRVLVSLAETLAVTDWWAAWGTPITVRPYLTGELQAVTNLLPDVLWKSIGPLTRDGHPRHPSRAAYRWDWNTFDVEMYLQDRIA